MRDRGFDLGSFCALVGAPVRECVVLRHAMVRGLKDYYRAAYGYDRYGAETVLHIPEKLSQPYIFGFAALQALRDRRISEVTKWAIARYTLDIADYGSDSGLPYGFYAMLELLQERELLSVDDLRYALVLSAGEYNPFRGMEKRSILAFFSGVVSGAEMAPAERAFWGHSLLARHQEGLIMPALVDRVMAQEDIAPNLRQELCRAWINCRQPHLDVAVPAPGATARTEFVGQHMPFWVAYAPSWPEAQMVRRGLVWLVRLGSDPAEVAATYLGHRDAFAEQLQEGAADILDEHWSTIPPRQLRALVEEGIALAGSIALRRRFYTLGATAFGRDYIERATSDTASSVRRWAVRQLQESG
ncbi:MAG TPA: hypothetical protein VKX16_02465 [Chloroflexota bacterium]|nr:hypothetical protein [Chloroflexota bacterium]